MWSNISASNGDIMGAGVRDIVAKEMTPSRIEEAQRLAAECAAKNYKGCEFRGYASASGGCMGISMQAMQQTGFLNLSYKCFNKPI